MDTRKGQVFYGNFELVEAWIMVKIGHFKDVDI